MAESRVVCVTKVASGDHHITEVGTGTDPNKATTQLTVTQVRTAIDNGDKFYSQGGGEKAYVEKFACCGVNTIRTKADDTTKDNLDTKRACNWS
jgi:phage-related protein